MSRSTGPILAMGAITMANSSVFHDNPVNWRIPLATGLLAIGDALLERAWPTGAVIIAWTGLLTVILTRTDSNTPSPVESLMAWWGKGS